MPELARVCVVIVNFNSATHVEACVASLTDPEIFSITIVDNGSRGTDRPLLEAIQAADTRVDVVWSDDNLGFAGGVNLGVERSPATGSDPLWILNPDTVVTSGAARVLAEFLSAGRADIVSPLIMTGHGPETEVWFAGGQLDTKRGVSWHWGTGKRTDPVPTAPTESPFITGAAPMLLKTAWDTLGGISRDFFLYWEDADLSVRAKRLGMKLFVVPEAVIWHEQGGSTGQAGGGNSPGYYYYGQRNRVLICAPDTGLARLLFGSGLRETARLLVQPLLDTSPRRAKFAASFLGLLDGARGKTGRGRY